ncbi:MAG: hypothetical protein LBS37_08585 [Treponema sp.]|jgi:hypothetical protein|nr:hypothetical protein [Treponema sp.]
MKKFFITLFILIILGGLAFFFGWVQLQVPPGAYGIVRSKTHGVDPRMIRSGEFRWLWYALIPTNVEVVVFRAEPVRHSVSGGNTLPSGNTYASFAGVAADFSWEFKASLSFTVNPDALVTLVSDNNIGSQDELDTYEQGIAEKMGAFILRRLSSGDADARQMEETLKTGSSPELERELAGQFPGLDDISCLVSAAKFPDFALYNEVRGLYEDFIAGQREYASSALLQKAESRIDSRLRFDELEQYGALLTKYPVLLDYLALERGISRNAE